MTSSKSVKAVEMYKTECALLWMKIISRTSTNVAKGCPLLGMRIGVGTDPGLEGFRPQMTQVINQMVAFFSAMTIKQNGREMNP